MDGRYDLIASAARVEFKYENAVFGKLGDELIEGNFSAPRDLMVLKWPFEIMDMAADRPGSDPVEPFDMIKEGEVVFDLGMPKVVPIANMGGIEPLEKIEKLPLGRDRLVIFAIFDPDPDAFFGGIVGHFGDAFQGPLEVAFADGFAFFYCGNLGLGKFLAGEFSGLHELPEGLGEVEGSDPAGVEDNQPGFETLCHVDRLTGQSHGPLAVLGTMGNEFVAIGIVHLDLGREGAKIVQTGDSETDFLPGIEDLPNHWSLEAVAEFDGVKSEREDLADDFFTVFFTVSIPTGGTGEHRGTVQSPGKNVERQNHQGEFLGKPGRAVPFSNRDVDERPRQIRLDPRVRRSLRTTGEICRRVKWFCLHRWGKKPLIKPVGRPRLLLFDFDGTIADTFDAAFEILNTLAKEFGFRPLAPEELSKARDMRTREVMKFLRIPMSKMTGIARRGSEEIHARMPGIAPLPGMPELLRALRDDGYELGIVTSNSEVNVNLFLEKHDLAVFSFIRSSSKLLGKARELRAVVKSHKIPMSEILFVGDETRDIEAAQKVGMPMAAVSWGYNSRRSLEEMQPDFLFDRAEELVAHLTSQPRV